MVVGTALCGLAYVRNAFYQGSSGGSQVLRTKGLIISGRVVHSTKLGELSVLDSLVLGVDPSGKICFTCSPANSEEQITSHGLQHAERIELRPEQFLLPGFVDAHVHASQFPYTGTGYDLPLLEWLKKYTFPTEAKYSDCDFARKAYTRSVARMVRNGTTTACYFGTLHVPGTLALVDVIAATGQRAYVGKVCMDRNAPDYYVEGTEESVRDTERFIQAVQAHAAADRITPCITPRFVPTCSYAAMQQLGMLAKKYDVPVQSHLSESKAECDWVAELHPQHASYTEVYDACGLLTNKTVMAHCIHLSDTELHLLRDRGTGIAHCANSNFSLTSGVLRIRHCIEQGVKVGLGTDVAGGYAPSMLDAARQAITASQVVHINDASVAPLSYREALSLATLGSSQALGLDATVGSFEVGKMFDAVVADPLATGSAMDINTDDSFEEVLSKFVFLGDDRNIASVFVNGRELLHAL